MKSSSHLRHVTGPNYRPTSNSTSIYSHPVTHQSSVASVQSCVVCPGVAKRSLSGKMMSKAFRIVGQRLPKGATVAWFMHRTSSDVYVARPLSIFNLHYLVLRCERDGEFASHALSPTFCLIYSAMRVFACSLRLLRPGRSMD